MGRASRGTWAALALALAIVLAAGAVVALGSGLPPRALGSGRPPRALDSGRPPRVLGSGLPAPTGNTDPLKGRGVLRLTVGGPARVQPISAGFLGLSLEYTAIEPYAGKDPAGVNPVLVQLIRNLTPAQAPVIRIGGDTTDWTWWPVPGMRRPGGVRYTLTPRWLAVTRALTQALSARLIMGIDMEAGSRRLAATEAQALTRGIGRASIAALEPGNEPELYGSWAWYHTKDGRRIHARPHGYDFPAYARDFSATTRTLGTATVAGPAAGSPKWLNYVGNFLAAEPRIGLVTLHRYPLQKCYVPESSPKYPTITHLLSPDASVGLAATLAGDVALAHARRVPLRIDEINTNSCGHSQEVTKTFASALWALDTLFAMAGVGVDGVNVHTYPKSTYALFSFTRSRGGWQGRVEPEYYGLLTFALAAPPGSRLLRVSGPATQAIRTWATRGADGRVRIALINDSPARSHTIAIDAPSAAPATVVRLRAPGLASRDGITLAGQSFGTSTPTGLLGGREHTTSLTPAHSAYQVDVPAASAAVLTLP